MAIGTEQIESANFRVLSRIPWPSLPTMNIVGLVKSIFHIGSPSIWAMTIWTPPCLA